MILLGHPTGNPNAHHTAMAYAEVDQLCAFVTAWVPSELSLGVLAKLPGCGSAAGRLRRRTLKLKGSPQVFQSPAREILRIMGQKFGIVDSADDRNAWLMNEMIKAMQSLRPAAVHAYEDCAQLSFEEAWKMDVRRIYELPTWYYPAWAPIYTKLCRRYSGWMTSRQGPPDQHPLWDRKVKELELADHVLVACSAARETLPNGVRAKVSLCPYGVDYEWWGRGCEQNKPNAKFIAVHPGPCSIRKGTPFLIEAWKRAELNEAELLLCGSWQMSLDQKHCLPPGVRHLGALSASQFRDVLQQADVMLLPSFSEGFGLVVLEALATGCPVAASPASCARDVVTPATGWVIGLESEDAWVDELRSFARLRDKLAGMRRKCRILAQNHSWANYHVTLRKAVLGS